ncbi:hypothetical protein HDV05_006321 [Chytridiales sp. JEL 0842]|nr:hypothetical protein HDV05_006321 [Chytridiales sp. JEL 0842]
MTTVKLESKEYPGTFAFDRIFDWSSTQVDVFQYAASAVVEGMLLLLSRIVDTFNKPSPRRLDVMKGYNGTIFAYGQTGAGKTFTMMGEMDSGDLKGLTPRLVESVFMTIEKAPSNLEFTVQVSYMEIYMEKIRDLLNPSQDNLPINEEKSRGVYVKGLLEPFVGSVDEIYDIMKQGQSARVVASTNMNAESSRSHSIFVIKVNQKNLTDGSARTGKLYLVDLAGSEKVGKTGATGQTLEEAKKINKSLSALGMVINALTDGKASAVTNAFMTRAKTIKNKAKVNAELSPAELKAMLKKAKQEVSTLQTYITSLEGEITQWRCGKSLSQSEWITLGAAASAESASTAAVPPAVAALMGPGSRAGTPVPALTEDEREEFLKRENELSDQLQEAQAALNDKINIVKSLQEELSFLKARDEEYHKENKELNSTLNDVKLQLEKVLCENKESTIVVDSVKEANAELEKELEELKKRLAEVQSAKQSETTSSVSVDEKEKLKQEKMAQMMAEFDPSGFMTEKEQQIRDTLAKLAHMKENSQPPSTQEEIAAQHMELIETRTQLAQQDQMIEELSLKLKLSGEESAASKKVIESLESKASTLEKEYQELLEKSIQEEQQHASHDVASVVQDIKAKLEIQFASKKDVYEKEIEALRSQLSHKDAELTRLQTSINDFENVKLELQSEVNQLKSLQMVAEGIEPVRKDEEVERMRKTMAQQLGEFDAMKKKLMRDLQNRCEKVVELEIALDETREQYNNILKNSNSRAQQQKMIFLERNLEQLTLVQKQLVDQNSSLKKDLAVAERKMGARNERIQNLETLLQDAQTKLEIQNQKFDAQLASMREKLQEARSTNPQASNWLYSSRIAKPLRGGGANPVSGENEESSSTLDIPDSVSKRTSWYVQLLKKN